MAVEESVRSPGAEMTNGCELPDKGTGTECEFFSRAVSALNHSP